MAFFLAMVLAMFPAQARGQTAAQLEMLRNNPELVRQRLSQSGITPQQVRTRLSAAGLDPGLLDAFLSGTGELPTVDEEVLVGISVLGVPDIPMEGLSTMPPLPPEPTEVAPDSLENIEPELELFGLQMFRTPTSQFLPVQSGPVPPNYRLGPGEVMVLVLTGGVESVQEIEVTREGFVVVPRVGQVYVNGLTMDEFRGLLETRLAESYSGIRDGSTRFDISITRLHANQVFVTGEVRQPGAYQLSSLATVLNAIFTAGGPKDTGNFREIQLRRGGELYAEFDLYDYLLNADVSNDVVLEQGDIVFIPTRGKRIGLSGAVVRPAIYELKDGEALDDLIHAAGGFLPDAGLDRISISRILPPGARSANDPARISVDVLLDSTLGGAAPAFPLEAGDQVHVFEVTVDTQASVTLQGNVYTPGEFAWVPGLRLSELVRRAGGFRPATYSGSAHVERLNPADSTRYLLSVGLPSEGSGAFPDDIEIHEYDIVTIYGREEFRGDRIVSIGGMVNEPGDYPYRVDMTLRDLVLQARGLRDGASLDEVEIARLPESREEGRLAERFRVSIDSTYLFERGTSFPLLPGEQGAENGSPEMALQPFDQVTVLMQPGFELLRSVKITGEVQYPGPYALERRSERVSDLIARAGGLTSSAYTNGSQFFRELGEAGRINLDLVEALDAPGDRHDFVLQPGDSLHIPEFDPTVRIVGAVNTPGSVLYESGRDLSYYVGAAGGYASIADPDRVGVRYANGLSEVKDNGFWFFGSTPVPEPGSTVFVPERDPEAQGFDVTGFFAGLGSVLASTVAIIVVATR